MDTIIPMKCMQYYSIKIERIAWAGMEWTYKGFNIAHSIK